MHPFRSGIGDIVDDYRNGHGARATGTVAGELILGMLTLGTSRGIKGITELAHLADELDDGPPAPPSVPVGPGARPAYGPTRRRVKLRKETKLAIIRKARRYPDGSFIGGPAKGRGSRLTIPYETKNGSKEPYKVNPETGAEDDHGMTTPMPKKFDFSHNPGDEWWRYKREAEAGGYDRDRVKEDQNDPNRYHLEDPSSNRSHKYELPP